MPGNWSDGDVWDGNEYRNGGKGVVIKVNELTPIELPEKLTKEGKTYWYNTQYVGVTHNQIDKGN